jgi:hypothetical protein
MYKILRRLIKVKHFKGPGRCVEGMVPEGTRRRCPLLVGRVGPTGRGDVGLAQFAAQRLVRSADLDAAGSCTAAVTLPPSAARL